MKKRERKGESEKEGEREKEREGREKGRREGKQEGREKDQRGVPYAGRDAIAREELGAVQEHCEFLYVYAD